MSTRTVNVRVLLDSDVDVYYVLQQLVTATSGPGAPLGVVELRDVGDATTSTTVWTRLNVDWDGESR